MTEHVHHECGHPNYPQNIRRTIVRGYWWYISRFIPLWLLAMVLFLVLPVPVLMILVPLVIIGWIILANWKPRR